MHQGAGNSIGGTYPRGVEALLPGLEDRLDAPGYGFVQGHHLRAREGFSRRGVVILAAVIVQARHGSPRSRCSSSNAAPSSRVLLRFALALSPSFRSGVWTLSDFHPVLVGGYIGREGLESLACLFGVVGSGDWRGV